MVFCGWWVGLVVSAGLGVASVAALRAKGFAIPELFGSGLSVVVFLVDCLSGDLRLVSCGLLTRLGLWVWLLGLRVGAVVWLLIRVSGLFFVCF